MKNEQDKKAKSNPFVEMEVTCPACGKRSTHLYLKNHVYRVEEREEDLFISKYHWMNPNANQYNLYSFFFWHCPFCKFTEDRNVFLRNKNGNTERTQKLIDAFLKKSGEDTVITLLAKYVKYPALDFHSILSLHLLATYIQLNANEFEENIEKVARYFLRTAWIYRTGKENTEIKAQEYHFNEFVKKYELLRSNAVNLLASLEETYQWLKEQIAKEEKHHTSGWSKYSNIIEEVYQDSIEDFDKILKAIQTYNSVGISYKKDISSGPDNITQARFHEFESYLDYLISIQKLWQELPLNEFMATQRAVYYYQRMILLKIYQSRKIRLFHIYKLIIFLSEKLADYETGIKYADQLLTEASRFRNTANRRKRNLSKLNEESDEMISVENYIKKSGEFIEFAKEKRSRMFTLKSEHYAKLAEDIFTQHRDLGVEGLKEMLKKAGIDDNLIRKYIAIKERENKKGIFQIFRF